MAVIELVSSSTPDERPVMVDLFSIDGVVYSVPASVRANQGLKFLWLAKTKDEQTAAIMMLEELIGEAGFHALMNYKDLKPENLEQILNAVVKILLGAIEEQKVGDEPGEGSRGSAK